MDNVFQQSKEHGVLTLRLKDRLDAALGERLDTEMSEIIRAGDYQVALDLSAVTYLSSAGIRFLLKTYQSLKKLGGSFSIIRPSPAVKSVLELAGLATLLQAGGAAPAAPRGAASAEREIRRGAAAYSVYETAPGASLACRASGDPARLEQGGFDPRSGEVLSMGRDLLALGLGRFQQAGVDSGQSFGEFMAVGGSAICMPADGGSIPDYMLTRGALTPQVRVLYALLCQGRFAQCVRFETGHEEGPESLSGLVRAGLDLAGSNAVGMAMLAESAGLIGATLRRAPAGPGAAGSVFAHPEIRDWLNFTPERVHDRCLALVTGVAVKDRDDRLAPFVRPLGADPFPAGHFHAAAFTFQALPNGPLVLDGTLAGLFEDARLLTVMHLVNDYREISGAGESLFTRGVMWVGPIEVGMVDG